VELFLPFLAFVGPRSGADDLWGTIIHVKSGHGVDPYPEIPMPRSMKGWQKKWFYLRNDVSALLPVFTGSYHVPLPSWGDGVARNDLGKLQPLREALQQLWLKGLTRVHLLRTFLATGSTRSGGRGSRWDVSWTELL
jgi:hypothetical protein